MHTVDEGARQLEEAHEASRRMLQELAFAPTAAAAGTTAFGAVLGGGLWGSGMDGLSGGVPAVLGVMTLTLSGCAVAARSAPRVAGQVGAAVWLVGCIVLMVISPTMLGYTLTSVSMLVGAILGTASAPPGSLRWGPVTCVVWWTGMALVPVPVDMAAPIASFAALLYMGCAYLLARITLRLHRNETAMRVAIEELGRRRAEAERASRAKSDFLARMSHELRTPLNAIIGYSELLLDEAGPDSQGDVARIRHAGHHLLGLVNDVLDTARVASGKLELGREPFVPGELLAEVQAVAGALAPARGNRLVWEVAGDLPVEADGDPKRVRQVLLNLVGNALKFTHDGEVRVEAGPVPDGWRVAVHDTGPGIDAATLAVLFEPFVQGPQAVGVVEGTGLGLSIARELVDAMGGRLTVCTEPGVGSVFEVVLPLQPAVAGAR